MSRIYPYGNRPDNKRADRAYQYDGNSYYLKYHVMLQRGIKVISFTVIMHTAVNGGLISEAIHISQHVKKLNANLNISQVLQVCSVRKTT